MWLVTGSQLTAWREMQSLGPRLQQPIAFCLSAFKERGHKWQPTCSLGHDPLFCEHARGHSAVLQPSRGKGPFFFFSLFLWHSHGLGCHVTLISSECPQGIHPNLYPKDWQCSACLRTSPHWLWSKASMWATSWLMIAVHCEFCSDFLFSYAAL